MSHAKLKRILLFGLGNFEQEYSKTRHNIGMDFLNYLSLNGKSKWRNCTKLKFSYSSQLLSLGDNDKKFLLLLVKPFNYMNYNGESLGNALREFKQLDRVVLFHDELELGFGRVRVKTRQLIKDDPIKLSNGHNGLKSVYDELIRGRYTTPPITQLKFGIGKPLDNSNQAIINHVLQRFTKEELTQLQEKVFKEGDLILRNILRSQNEEIL
ncbi:hypothetical protein MP638_001526 [Amoeboaphelidium occidentale]|nr:hypothetical protein MP638_001526 [Amoeboaphelidium occidentale]